MKQIDKHQGGLFWNMNLIESYRKVKPSVVAIASRVKEDPLFPDIIGTGFVAREDGIIFTCKHVIDAIKRLPGVEKVPPNEWPIMALAFRLAPEGMKVIPLNVRGAGGIKKYLDGKHYYGEDVPDVGLLDVNVKNLPALELSENGLSEGMEIGITGFPMGTETLRAPGWIHQISPTLKKGIISAILPFPCDNPHALLLDLMTQSGSSGSPVFDINTGKVVGMIYAGLEDSWSFAGNKGILYTRYQQIWH